MSTESPIPKFPLEKRERLVMILHPKRASFIFYYVFGVVLFLVGLTFMILASLGTISHSILSWSLSLLAMIFGVFLTIGAETRHYFTLYIITTWNVRLRKGIFRRTTIRVFYDEIALCRTSSNPEERRVGMGDVEICTNTMGEKPAIIFDEVHNPEGVKEIISRFTQSLPDPLPWAHLDRK
ncbi:MAG: PH domain-containing protein [Candidatus Thorarchaeota archaeon]